MDEIRMVNRPRIDSISGAEILYFIGGSFTSVRNIWLLLKLAMMIFLPSLGIRPQ